MPNMTSAELPKRYHDAVVKWRQTYLPDYDYLIENWQRFFKCLFLKTTPHTVFGYPECPTRFSTTWPTANRPRSGSPRAS